MVGGLVVGVIAMDMKLLEPALVSFAAYPVYNNTIYWLIFNVVGLVLVLNSILLRMGDTRNVFQSCVISAPY